ncbi:MAG TPA: glycosyltransferase, partial [Terriglobales bacterium]|nr:glycosyltransferase [Terriglobales bacterium]
MTAPRLSVIVLTFDRPQLLRGCLASLAEQSFPAEQFEIVVADDGSGPETAHVMQSHARTHGNVRHVRHTHRGIAATR